MAGTEGYGGKLKDMAGNGIYTEELVRKT